MEGKETYRPMDCLGVSDMNRYKVVEAVADTRCVFSCEFGGTG